MDAAGPHRWPILARSRLVVDLEQRLATRPPGCPGIAVSGPPGAGASVLLDLLSRRHSGLVLRNRRLRPTGPGAGASQPWTELHALVQDLPPGALLCVDGLEDLTDDEAAEIADASAAGRIPILATARSRTAARLGASRHALRHLQVVPVPPLTGEQVQRLCVGRFGVPVEPLTLRRLLDLSEGRPGPLVAVVEHNLHHGSLQLRRGLIGGGDLVLPPELSGPDSCLVHARPATVRAVLAAAVDGPLTRAAADALADPTDLADLLADGLLQTAVVDATTVVGLTERARDLMVSVAPPVVADHTFAVRSALRAGHPVTAVDLATRLHGAGIAARCHRATAVGAALLAEAHLERGGPDAAETAAHQALCLLEMDVPTDPLLGEVLALAAVCAAWRSAGSTARALAAEAEGRLRSSSGRAAVRLAEMDLLLGDAHGAARRARRVAASATAPDVALDAAVVLARADPGGQPPAAADPGDPPLRRLVEALHTRDGAALLDLALAWAASGSTLLAGDTAARAEPLLRSVGDTAAAARAGHLVATTLTATGIVRPTGWPTARVGGLTARESEVAALAIAGVTAAETAAALHLSVRTVENHLQHCYTKCGVGSRQELAAALGRPADPAARPGPVDRPERSGTGVRPAMPATRVPVTAARGRS
ncbi:hypothetical protein GCM10009818_21130 [Nakamurella flavida]